MASATHTENGRADTGGGPEFRVISPEAEDVEHAKTLIRLAKYHKIQPRSLAKLLGDEFWRDIAQVVAESKGTVRSEMLAIWPKFQADRLGTDGARMKAAILEAEPLVEAEPDEPVAPVEERFEVLDLMSFLGAEYQTTYLVDGVLAKGQPCVMAAPKKALKTSTCTDLVISLATGTSFLGTFEIREPQRVLFISAESGGSKLQSSMKRVLAAKGLIGNDRIAAAVEDRLDVMLRIPKILDPLDMEWFAQRIRRFHPSVVVYDPFYRGLAGGGEVDHSNIFSMGEALSKLNEICEDAGVTLVIVHHFRKSIPPGDAPELDHIAYAGMAEWARQWILMARHATYVPGSGVHELRVVMGGSEGHESDHVVTIDEGKPQDEGRKWDVTVKPFEGEDDPKANDTAQKTYQRAKGQDAGKEKHLREKAMEVWRWLQGQAEAQTVRTIRDRFRINSEKAGSILAILADAHSVEQAPTTRDGREFLGWKATCIPPDHPFNTRAQGGAK